MRKIIIFIIICTLVAGMAYGKGKSSKKGKKKHHYSEPVVVDAIGFRATYQNGVVETRWKKYLRDDLKHYKVVKSNTNTNPVYPDDGYIYATGASDKTTFTDRKVTSGTWYYRVCIITKQGDRWVSSVVRVDVKQTRHTKPSAKDFE